MKEYYFTMNNSKYFNKDSYEVRRLYSHISMLQEELDTTKEQIKKEQNYLQNFMKDKAEFYEKIRRNRKKEGE